MVDYDELFERKMGGVGGGWYDQISPECRAWIDGLADRMRSSEREPNWYAVMRSLRENYPDEAPRTVKPIMNALRRLASQ